MEADFLKIGFGDNLEVSRQDFSCGSDFTKPNTFRHRVSTDKGTDHTALIFLDEWNTNKNNHLSFSSSCSFDGENCTCELYCYGAGKEIRGSILFIDGDFTG